MIRWYDYIVAIVVADLILTSFLYSITSDIWYMSLLAAITVYALWDIWKAYCEWRKVNEAKR